MIVTVTVFYCRNISTGRANIFSSSQRASTI